MHKPASVWTPGRTCRVAAFKGCPHTPALAAEAAAFGVFMLPVSSSSRKKAPVGLNSRRASSRWLVPLVTAVLLSWVSSDARGAPEPDTDAGFGGGAFFHPDLERAAAEWARARGASAYTALRQVWQQWDRADPAQVEEVLREASQSPRLAPPLRAYAELLVAYARLRRGDATDAKRRVSALRFVDQWAVLGPFDNTGKVGFEAQQGPEPEMKQPLAWGVGYSGKDARQVRWRLAPAVFPYGWVDAAALVRPRQPVCAFFASHVFQQGLERRRPISLWVGARGAFRLFWNGSERLVDPAYRGHDFDRRAAAVWLEPGENRVVVKVCGDEAAPMLSLRLADPTGAPDPALEWRAEATAPAGAPDISAGAPEQRAFGPLQWFERQTRDANASAAQREAFARYLNVTDGDDAALHLARDLAHRAAASPSVPRLLLAAELAEDRNERARWIERARAELAHSPPSSARRELADVLLAEASLLEQGLSPQTALPLYEQVLALDPDDLRAISGKARLYDSAGLKRSALSLVEAALGRNPHGVALLNMYTSGLGELGQTEESQRAESLYSALRFDDHGPLVDNIELAVQQRNRPLAEHWVERLLLLSPDSAWASGVAARAYRAFNQPERAVASYERALGMAPDDVDVLRELADLQGELGHPDEQLALLRRVLGLAPQNSEVRQYVEALEPSVVRADEAYAWAPERFLNDRFEPSTGFHRRTLLDLTVTQVYENGLAGQFRQIVFQPLTETGAAVGRQYSFSFQADRQRAQLRGARVYRASGAVDEAIESGEGPADDPELSTYTSARTVYVQFPRLEPGDVVELKYRVDDVGERGEFAGYFGELEYLQSEAPISHAEYVVITPKDRRLYIDAQRIPGLQQSVELHGSQRVHKFRADGLLGVGAEPAMPPWSEVLGFVHVSTYPSYRELGAWYWGLSRDQLELDSATRELIHRITAQATSTREKVKIVYDWVVKNTRYVALEFGIYGYKPRRAVQTVTRGWGDCKDKAAVIVAMLNELDIPATMVLVRSGQRGRFQSEVASLAPFDHAIAYVPELNLYLDGTAEFSGSGELPAMDQGALALQVNAGTAKMVTLPDNDPLTHVKRRQVTLHLSAAGLADIELEYQTNGPSASSWRRRYSADATRRARVLEDLSQEFPGLEIPESGIAINDLSNYELPVSVKVRGRAPRLLREEGGTFSLSVTPSERLGPAYGSLTQRRLDVDIGAFPSLDETYVVYTPPGYDVLSAPVASKLESPFGSYSVELSQEPGKLNVHSRLQLAVSHVEPQRYPEFRRFCQAVDLAFDQRLVLGAHAR
jgi:tetratricopeptide (TPR) repeat protein/transglutaminase-like putative cysteine protease